MLPRLIAFVTLLILTAPILAAPMAAASGGARSGCAMCVRQCACRPAGGGGRCRMAADCGSAARQDAASIPNVGKGILPAVASDSGLFRPSAALFATADLRPMSRHFVPPTPPPRSVAPVCS